MGRRIQYLEERPRLKPLDKVGGVPVQLVFDVGETVIQRGANNKYHGFEGVGVVMAESHYTSGYHGASFLRLTATDWKVTCDLLHVMMGGKGTYQLITHFYAVTGFEVEGESAWMRDMTLCKMFSHNFNGDLIMRLENV